MGKWLLAKCLRCGGALIHDKFYSSYEQFWGWRCLICGEIVDPVILENRRLMRDGKRMPGENNLDTVRFQGKSIAKTAAKPFR